ncbi:MAG: flippase-like domain-containing protein [Candidatus Azobacteroides sp.]|nr:flippase-like domain-containing protein [Candidatus Azobacteroides sp.]
MFEKIKPISIQILKIFIPLAFGLFVFWLIFRTLPFNQIMFIVRKDVNYRIIALSLPFGLFANIMRAYRWGLLIHPLGYRPKTSNLIYSFLGNYAVNLAIPRVGEIWRCTMISRYEKIPFTALIGTMITDRLFDLFPIGLIVVIAFILNVPYFKLFFAQNPVIFDQLHAISTSVWLYVFLAIIGIVIWFSFTFLKRHTFIRKTKMTLLNIWKGIRSISQMKANRMFIFYTFLIWLGYFLYFYICFYAFPFTKNLGWNCGLIAFGISSIAVTIPVQAGIGAWHAAVIAVLTGFGLSSVDAGAFAVCVHTIQAIVFTAIIGLFGIMALPIANKKNK